MPWGINYMCLAFLCLYGLTNGQRDRNNVDWNKQPKSTLSDIEFDKEPVEVKPGEGSGAGWDQFSDDEDFGESGSGSGSGMGLTDTDGSMETGSQKFTSTPRMTTTTMVRTTSRPLTACETMKKTSKHTIGLFVPRCLPNGDFDSLQCHGHPGTADCWCTDLEGREIPGTLMEAPNFPNCDEGDNLPPCVHQLVKNIRSKLLGSFKPKCAVDGQFDRVQCRGSMCYCVDESTGEVIPGTQVHKPDSPSCDDDSVYVLEVTTRKPRLDQWETKKQDIVLDTDEEGDQELVFPDTEDGGETIDLDQNEGMDKSVEEKEIVEEKFGETNKAETKEQPKIKPDSDGHHKGKVETANEIMTQPGILAGIIGGSVVLLLCLVLLVMFIIYRMRKKDEGSYPLDEPRRTPNYSYVRAPEKEFYA